MACFLRVSQDFRKPAQASFDNPTAEMRAEAEKLGCVAGVVAYRQVERGHAVCHVCAPIAACTQH